MRQVEILLCPYLWRATGIGKAQELAGRLLSVEAVLAERELEGRGLPARDIQQQSGSERMLHAFESYRLGFWVGGRTSLARAADGARRRGPRRSPRRRGRGRAPWVPPAWPLVAGAAAAGESIGGSAAGGERDCRFRSREKNSTTPQAAATRNPIKALRIAGLPISWASSSPPARLNNDGPYSSSGRPFRLLRSFPSFSALRRQVYFFFI